ncbi:pantetheine-phosphate adenylyltransferase, partial [Escherichia coli]|nr:pantetheine-phosphate adenylyltransferase [Escherichia coli]
GMDHLSSSLIKQVAGLGGDVTGMVPEPVIGPLLERVGASR